eukprot:scaffold31216_cov40-Prasinocladus_malaysianus.AAC.2
MRLLKAGIRQKTLSAISPAKKQRFGLSFAQPRGLGGCEAAIAHPDSGLRTCWELSLADAWCDTADDMVRWHHCVGQHQFYFNKPKSYP